MVGFQGDDDHWVALKGGTFTLSNAGVTTSADTRLVMADFSDPDEIVSMPVLRGDFEAAATGSILETTSAPADTYLLVKQPMNETLDTGFTYTIDLGIADDRLRGQGTIQRIIRPTADKPATTFTFDAEWSMQVQGGSTLQGQLTYQAVSASVFNVGSLLVSPPTSGYGIEHNPAEANALNPAAVPKFKQIRMTGATLAQPDTTGAAELPVQAVLLMAPGTAVKDYEVEAGNGTKTLKTIALECGTGNQVCFDLRGDEDTGPPIIDNVVREYRMPDLIVQDEANMIMINTASGVEIASTDHPKSKLSDADDLSFSYEAFDAGVRTFRGPCPLPRDPLNPDQGGGAGPETTIIQGTAGMSIPNAGSDGVSGGGPRISVTFILCETSLRELTFTFDTGDNTAIPLGNSSLFLNFFSGTVSIAPQQPGQDSYVTVVLEVRFRGMQPAKEGSTLFARGVVTIDSRGLFDVQINAGIQVFAGIGVGVDGHFWVAWSPLDIGFIVEACVPFDAGFDAENFPSTGLCEGNELLFGSFKAHMWQGQGWQNRYDWLPDDDAIHVTAR
ncbi:MAG: hypothetical protein HC914_12085, partial [Chloroflexaceae bacterium]|nr:hypothetical protein [Chloroflexaceae bacterium]